MSRKSKGTTPGEFREYCREHFGEVFDKVVMNACVDNNCTLQQFYSRSRKARYCLARKQAAIQMRGLGLTYVEIAELMKKSHTNIIYLCNEKFNEKRKESMKRYYNARKQNGYYD